MAAGKSPGQIPLDLSHEPSVKREDLVESRSNAMAISMIDAWPDWPGYAVVLAGPVGSGKTHIASAWVSMAGGQICDAADVAGQLANLQEHLAQGSNIVIEDAGPGAVDDAAFFHLLNSVRQAGRHCLITSRSWPLEWGVTLPDLVSRLKALQIIELSEPDDLLLKQVMFKLFADRQLNVDDRVVDYCVLRMERSLGSAARLVEEIDKIALARKTSISRNLAGDALAGLGMN